MQMVSTVFLVSLMALTLVLVIVVVLLLVRSSVLLRQSQTDKLTGLWNRHFLEMYLPKSVSGAERHSQGLAIIMLDLDGFKQLNDTQGHLTGDVALRDISLAITSNLRASDIVVRYGGDEFVIIVSSLAGEAWQAARKVCLVIEKLDGVCGGITASIGVACYPRLKTARELLEAADTAMYQAKAKGGNEVVIWGEEVC